MREKCDCCGSEIPILEITFTGRQYLCPECQCLKKPTLMGVLSMSSAALRG